MTFTKLRLDESVVSTIVYVCYCHEDDKECLITAYRIMEMLAQGHVFN
jgi:hypothetical protein